MKRFWLLMLGLVLGSILINGCASDTWIEGINVSIVDFRPVHASMLETQALMTLRYTNENVGPLAISGSKHRLFLNGTYVGEAVSKQALGLPRLSTGTETVTVYLQNLALLRNLQSIANASKVSYRLDSEIYTTIDESKKRLKSTSTGEVDLSAFAKAE